MPCGKIDGVFCMPGLDYFCVMNLFRIVIELFGLYLLYKVIFDVIIPFAGAYRKAKKQFGEMRDANRRPEPEVRTESKSGGDSRRKEPPVGDYIDFEEIK